MDFTIPDAAPTEKLLESCGETPREGMRRIQNFTMQFLRLFPTVWTMTKRRAE
jgi:hypothetical protein